MKLPSETASPTTGSEPRVRRVAVIGGGISGLAAAHRLLELDSAIHVEVLESSNRLGGVLHTETHDGYLLEHSADSFVTNVPWAVDLCRRVGLADALEATNPAHRGALVVRNGRLHRIPEGFILMGPSLVRPLLTTRILSLKGKLRLLCERLVPRRRESGDESLAAFATRRLGREVFERLVQPLVSGIYTSDASQLSMEAALPRFVEMETRHGSLWRGMRMEADWPREKGGQSGARYSLFVAPRLGVESLVRAIAERLPRESIYLDSRVEAVERLGDGSWKLSILGSAPRQYDGLIVAAPAPQASQLLRRIDEPLASSLAAIGYAGSAVVLAGYRRDQVRHPLDAFGLVVPEREGRRLLAVSFSSVKFPHRSPADRVLLRAFVGGAKRPDLVDLDESSLRSIVEQELAELLGVRGEPELFRVCRWHARMPQYHVGHVRLVSEIDRRVADLGGLELAGNAYSGVGIPHCIRSGEEAARRLVERLRSFAA